MRLIDGDALIAWIKESQHMTSKMRNIICKVETMPSADRPQGEWIGCRHEDSEWLSPMADFYKCSICGKIVNLLQMRSYNFCPNCGARMKGANDE